MRGYHNRMAAVALNHSAARHVRLDDRLLQACARRTRARRGAARQHGPSREPLEDEPCSA